MTVITPITRHVVEKTTATTSAKWVLEDGLNLAALKRIVADCEAANLPDNVRISYYDPSMDYLRGNRMQRLAYFSINIQEVVSERDLSNE